MRDLALIMPMAGRGSRFLVQGETRPKPLIELCGHPLFYWAAESVLRAARVREKIFVVLDEHVAKFCIDERILAYYPDARIIAIPAPTSGAAESAAIGIEALEQAGPIAINDCDHAFTVRGLGALIERDSAGALVGFASTNPAYSFVKLADDDHGSVCSTVEKQCAGPFAIAGCYLFRDQETFVKALTSYRITCPYPELFLSGLYNLLCQEGEKVRFLPLDRHFSFGTPEEFAQASSLGLHQLIEGWSA
jgi:dTDP-glucose pyrophosphorylase